METNTQTQANSKPAFHRLELLTGKDGLERLKATPVILFGVGGVGSWCAEALVRSGIHNLTIVDSDLVCATNINRQLQATHNTVGEVKVDVLRERLLTINPDASITALKSIYHYTTASEFKLDQFPYVIDAIDSLSCKVELIVNASEAGAKVYSALGASCKLDPTRIKVAPLWKTEGCRLGHFVRKRLRKRKFNGDITCVYSDEPVNVITDEVESQCGTGACMCPKFSKDGTDAHEWCNSKKQINGSIVHITGIFGFTLAGLVVQSIINSNGCEE
jgi:tRNA A37 threonylcarbamoyladenosine dehydratase